MPAKESDDKSRANTGWHEAEDGSKMKVTSDEDSLKTERISNDDDEGRHDHDVVKVDKPSGSVKEISVGKNSERSRDKR